VPDLMVDFAASISDEVDPSGVAQVSEAQVNEANETSVCQALIANNQLHEASKIVSTILDKMIDDGAHGLRPVRLLLQRYENMIANLPPLAHLGTAPLQPNDMMYSCFDQFLMLIHQQQRQVQELQTMLAEHL
jgi:hypothetical protein